jgi:hypothetical protein
MKIIISKEQYKVISEQIPDTRFTTRGMSDDEHRKIVYGTPQQQKAVATMMEIGMYFLPVVGPYLGLLFGATHASDEWEKGNKKTASIIGVLSLLPFIPKLSSLIPEITTLGVKGMESLSNKIITGAKNLTNAESKVLTLINTQKNLINSELSTASQILSKVGKNIESLKPSYIDKYGQSKYDELLTSLLSKKITPETFVKNLESGVGSTLSKVAQNLIKVYRAGPKRDNMFYVSPNKSYVLQNYAKGAEESIYSMNINPGKVLDLTKINPESLKITQLVNYLKKLGVVFNKEEMSQLLSKFSSNKSTTFNKIYPNRPLWQFINFDNSIANAAKRSGFDSIKQFETTSVSGGAWDWSKGGVSYFILNLIK